MQPDNHLSAQPAPSKQTPEPTPPIPDTVQPAHSTPISPSTSPKQPHSKLPSVLLILLILVVIVVGAIIYHHENQNKVSGVTKKDIPVFNYAILNDGLSSFYPYNTTDIGSQVNSQLFEGLVRYEQQDKIVPLLATNWYNASSTKWIFNLRHGVKFHSGQTMTAQDVQYSLNYAVAHQSADDQNTAMQFASTIQKATVTGPYQVTITTTNPDPTLLNRLTQLYIMDSTAKVGSPDAGTGPYIITPGTTPSNNTLDLTAFNDYWGGHVYTRSVHFQSVNGSQAVAQAHNYNLIGELSASQLAQLKGESSISVPTLGATFLGLNTMQSGSPFESLQARQAAAYALNIQQIIKVGGLAATQANQLIPSAIPGHNPSITTTPYDPAKAKQLLAGVKDAAAPLTLEYVNDASAVKEITTELNAVGFNITATQEPDLGTLVNAAVSGQTAMFYLTYDTNIFDGVDILSSTVVDPNYTNPTFDNLISKASNTIVPTTRIGLMQQASTIVATNLPDIPLYAQSELFAVSNASYHIQLDIPSAEAGVYFWQTYKE